MSTVGTKRKRQGEDCPACCAEGELPLGAAERVDLARYEDVDCPLCEAKGSHDGDTCHECLATRRCSGALLTMKMSRRTSVPEH